MPFAALLVGAIIVIVAINNTYPQLASELENDVPGYFKWAVAIAAILGLGFVPGFRTPSRWLLALVLLVLVLNNYQQILSGFTSFAGTGSGSTTSPTSATTPTTTTTAPTSTSSPVAASGGTTTPSSQSSSSPSTAAPAPANMLDPQSYLNAFSGFGSNVA